MKLTFKDLQVGTCLLLADRSAEVLVKDYARHENDDIDQKKYWTMKEAVKNQQLTLCVMATAGVIVTGFELMKGVIKIIRMVKH